MRRKYENNPKSLLGRFWRWHIGFCPGWKQYFASIPEEEKEDLRVNLNSANCQEFLRKSVIS